MFAVGRRVFRRPVVALVGRDDRQNPVRQRALKLQRFFGQSHHPGFDFGLAAPRGPWKVRIGVSCLRALSALPADRPGARHHKLDCNFNYISVRSFILTGAPLTSSEALRATVA